MTDIVERLRNGHDTCDFNKCRVREAKSGCTCAEAADEIERLREACKNVSSYISVRDQFAMAALTGMLMRSVGYEETSEKAYKFADAMIKTRAALGEKE